MPNHTYKSAAVPFVNQKGERSMKRVKVERYVAGKKPGYAKEEDDDEYYTTDEEEIIDDEEHVSENEETIEPSEEDGARQSEKESSVAAIQHIPDSPSAQDSDDDDPRFRKLKHLESKPSTSRLLETHTASLGSKAVQKFEDRNIVIDDDEEEDEIRHRHATARARTPEEPIGPHNILEGFTDPQSDVNQSDLKGLDGHSRRKEQTEDILRDLKLTGIKPKQKKAAEKAKAEEKFKELIEHARQEAIFTEQIHKKIEEDNRRELLKEALSKDGVGAFEMEAIKTDDEDEELAYEEWKLREIKRVLRDRSERALETKAR